MSMETKLLPCAICMRGNGDSTPCEKWQKCQPSGEARLFIMQGREEDVAAKEENCCNKPPEPKVNKETLADMFEAGQLGGGDIYAPDEATAKDAYKEWQSYVMSLPLAVPRDKVLSDGSTASYYELPTHATELQHLISHRNMNAQIGEIFRACYRYGIASHSNQLRDAKKIKFYAEAEIARLEVAERLGKYENKQEGGYKS